MRAMWTFFVAVTLAGLAVAAAPPATSPLANEYAAHVARIKKRLPDFTVVVQEPFVVTGDDDPEKFRERQLPIITWTVSHLKKDFFEKDPTELIDIYLFKDKTSYDKYNRQLFPGGPDTIYGYYSPDHKALIMNIATGGGTLVHEIVHPFMAANFPGCPTWFNEGLASLYEQSAERQGHIVGLTNWRLEGLQKWVKTPSEKPDEKVPGFKDMCTMTSAEFYGAGRGPNYAAARYLCYYLQEKDVLRQFYKDFTKNQKNDPTGYVTLSKTLANLGEKDMDAFRKKWDAWVLGLHYP